MENDLFSVPKIGSASGLSISDQIGNILVLFDRQAWSLYHTCVAKLCRIQPLNLGLCRLTHFSPLSKQICHFSALFGPFFGDNLVLEPFPLPPLLLGSSLGSPSSFLPWFDLRSFGSRLAKPPPCLEND